MTAELWAAIVAMGVSTYLLRASFLVWLGRRSMPRFERALRYVPAAVLPALTVVALRGSHGDAESSALSLLAAAVGGLVAWHTRSVLLTMASGMIALWLLRALVAT